ncbi:MAG: MerR family transcriptional regulator [Aquaticitalea sp.]
MNNFKSTFSIKDLEHLSGIKAHTIRIWEKRYNLLQPERTDTNIRYYDLESLQMLLNVSYLNSNGYKISKIASLTKEEVAALVRKFSVNNESNDHALNLFKLAMLNFDQHLFYSTYNNLSKEKSFNEIFFETFIPLLSEIGVLWQTDTITPAHEHFISTLIRQKICANTENYQSKNQTNRESTFVLFLPDNEIHELGLLYLNLEITAKGHHSILLGPSVPINNLLDLLSHHKEITFISYFTVQPEKEQLDNYLKEFEETILSKENTKFWILGKMVEYINTKQLPDSIRTFKSINELVKEI